MRRAAALALALAALAPAGLAATGCHARPSTSTGTCRDVAQAGERWLAAATPARRDETLRLAVEIVDLCQRPGLGPLTRNCVTAAASADAVRACPALPLVRRGALPAAAVHQPLPDDDDATGDDDE